MVVVGDGPKRQVLTDQAAALGLSERVRFPGFIGHDRLPDLAAAADVGVLPFHACPHIESTLANKLFEYMSVALPVVCSDVAPMVRILDETRAGLCFRSGDAGDLADVIERVAGDAEAAKRFGECGERAVRERYHWGVDAQRFLDALDRL